MYTTPNSKIGIDSEEVENSLLKGILRFMLSFSIAFLLITVVVVLCLFVSGVMTLEQSDAETEAAIFGALSRLTDYQVYLLNGAIGYFLFFTASWFSYRRVNRIYLKFSLFVLIAIFCVVHPIWQNLSIGKISFNLSWLAYFSASIFAMISVYSIRYRLTSRSS